jgi:hypothetical protein
MTTLATFALASQRDQGGGSDGLMVGPQSLPPLQPRNTRKVGLSAPARWRVIGRFFSDEGSNRLPPLPLRFPQRA